MKLVGHHAMCHPDENDSDAQTPSLRLGMLKDDNADSSSDVAQSRSSSSSSALSSFFAGLMAGDLDHPESSSSSASSSLPATSFCIIDDGATSLNRSDSLSFQRAERNMLRRNRRRRRTRAIDTNCISRWESYPQPSQTNEKCPCKSLKNKPERRLSPTPTSIVDNDCQQKIHARVAVHNALIMTETEAQKVRNALHKDNAQKVRNALHKDNEDAKPNKLAETFTPCSSWLDVVAQHGSFSPKPVQKKTVKRAASVPADKNKSDGAAAAAPARIIRRSSGDSCSIAASLRADRAARLCGAPRRPHRQASLTDVTRATISLAQHLQEGSGNSDHGPRRSKHVNDDDGSEESFQDATSAEWKEICARSA